MIGGAGDREYRPPGGHFFSLRRPLFLLMARVFILGGGLFYFAPPLFLFLGFYPPRGTAPRGTKIPKQKRGPQANEKGKR